MIEVLKLGYDVRGNQCLLLGMRWRLTQKGQRVTYWGDGRGVGYTGEY